MTKRMEEPDFGADSEFVELALLLPRWQVQALATAASRRGMTAGQMLRRVIGEMLANPPQPANP